jgi:hypothetical protein
LPACLVSPFIGSLGGAERAASSRLFSNRAISLSKALSLGSLTKMPEVLFGSRIPISLVVLSDDTHPLRSTKIENVKSVRTHEAERHASRTDANTTGTQLMLRPARNFAESTFTHDVRMHQTSSISPIQLDIC